MRAVTKLLLLFFLIVLIRIQEAHYNDLPTSDPLLHAYKIPHKLAALKATPTQSPTQNWFTAESDARALAPTNLVSILTGEVLLAALLAETK